MVPSSWSQVATDVLAQKYCRKAGVPSATKRVPEEGVPAWLQRSEVDEAALALLPAERRYGGESDSRQVFHRMAGCWTYWEDGDVADELDVELAGAGAQLGPLAVKEVLLEAGLGEGAGVLDAGLRQGVGVAQA